MARQNDHMRDMRKIDTPTVSAEHLAHAISTAAKMDLKEKEQVCDAIFTMQPNLLGSVLVQKPFGASMETIDVLLNMLIVLHLAIDKSGQALATISEEEQRRQLELFAATVNFSEGMDDKSVSESIRQCAAYKREKFLLAYVIETMKHSGFFDDQAENAKYPIIAGINLVNCIANAKRLV